MRVLGVDYVYFPVADLEKATAFYRDVLGLTPVFSMGGMWGELQAGEPTVALHVADDAPVAPSASGMAVSFRACWSNSDVVLPAAGAWAQPATINASDAMATTRPRRDAGGTRRPETCAFITVPYAGAGCWMK